MGQKVELAGEGGRAGTTKSTDHEADRWRERDARGAEEGR